MANKNLSFSEYNRMRCEHPQGFNHKLSGWSLSDWMAATLGELGEAANVIKKINRHRDGIAEQKPVQQLMEELSDELADADIYLDLLYQAAGLNRTKAVISKFNDTSMKRKAPFILVSLQPMWGMAGSSTPDMPAGSRAPAGAEEIHPAPRQFSAEELAADPILRFFHFEHLPPTLRGISAQFCRMASLIIDSCPRNAERTAALRKLLEAKDCAVRAALP